MEIILYIVIGLTGLLGIGVLISASNYNFKHWGLTLAGLSYLLGAFISYKTMTWYAVIISWGLTFLIRKFFGDSFKK